MKTKRRIRPSSGSILLMMLFNAGVSLFVFALLFRVFGIHDILPGFAARHAWAEDAANWDMYATLIPGAAISLALLWFWLILTGRTSRGLSWGAAAVYGVIIGLYNVPVSGLLTGLLHGSGLLGLLIGLVIMILVPSIAICMICFGAIMGLLNGWLAQRWIDHKYAGRG